MAVFIPVLMRLSVLLLALALSVVPAFSQLSRSHGSPSIFVSAGLAPPSGLFAYPCGNSVELHWRDNSTAETGFVVRRKAAGAAHFQDIALLPAGTTTFTDPSAPNGSWLYRVAARASLAGKTVYSPPSNAVQASLPNLPPALTTTLASRPDFAQQSVLQFTVTATDPEGDRVGLTLLNPAPGMQFTPLVGAASPATFEVRWVRRPDEELHPHLVFAANCGVLLKKDVSLKQQDISSDSACLIGDVTGDGLLDAVVTAEHAAHFPADGAVYVFSGATAPQGAPVATLRVASEELRPRSAGFSSSTYYAGLADLDGDGVLDVVCSSVSQKIYVWSGGPGLSGTPVPTAVLDPPGTSSTASSLDAPGTLLQFVDLDHDGIDDLVTYDRLADVAGVPDAGAAFLWFGSPTLAGNVSPDRVLSVPGAVSGDWLGFDTTEMQGTGVDLVDVNGDGVLDFLVAAARADVGGVVDAGALYYWSGSQVLAGATAPTATLAPAGYPSSIGPPMVADVTGDGALDIVTGRTRNGRGNPLDREIHVWAGPDFAGSMAPTCTLRLPLQSNDMRVALADATGDGVLDVMAMTADQGTIFVWHGGDLRGTPAPDASLHTAYMYGPQSLWFEDLTGDGVLDVVSGNFLADAGAGQLYIWQGGALAGTIGPSVTLRANDTTNLGEYTGLWIEDLDGDGTPDVLSEGISSDGTHSHVLAWSGASGYAGTMDATLLGLDRAGILMQYTLGDLDGDGHVDLLAWTNDSPSLFFRRGGSSFFDANQPDAVLRSTAESGPTWVDFEDANGDGVLDAFVTFYTDNVGTGPEVGSIQVWLGGALFGSPALTLSVPGARPNDYLGVRGLRFADLTGDRRPDFLAISPFVDLSDSQADTGAIEFWDPVQVFAGNRAPGAVFADSNASYGDRLGDAFEFL